MASSKRLRDENIPPNTDRMNRAKLAPRRVAADHSRAGVRVKTIHISSNGKIRHKKLNIEDAVPPATTTESLHSAHEDSMVTENMDLPGTASGQPDNIMRILDEHLAGTKRKRKKRNNTTSVSLLVSIHCCSVK